MTHRHPQSQTVKQLTGRLCAILHGDGSGMICGVNTIQDAQSDEICFFTDIKHAGTLGKSQAGAVLVAERIEECLIPQLVVENVQRALIEVMRIFTPPLKPFEGIHPTAVVESDAYVDSTAVVGPGVYIGHEVKIGPGTVIGPNGSVGERSTIGQHCRLDANVSVYHDCQIGNHCIILSNSTIGSTGFGYVFVDGQHRLIPHNGGVIIEDGVEIGANTCIDRAKFGNTLIGAGTKIDNQVQIAHNDVIGKMCLIAGQAGLAGSVCLGDGVVLAGRAGAGDHVTIGSGSILGAVTSVFQDVEPGSKLWAGTPAMNVSDQIRCQLTYKRLPEMAKELKKLKKRVAELESAKNHKK